MDKSTKEKIIAGIVFMIPLGMSAIVGYYGYKKYAKYKANKKAEREKSNNLEEGNHKK